MAPLPAENSKSLCRKHECNPPRKEMSLPQIRQGHSVCISVILSQPEIGDHKHSGDTEHHTQRNRKHNRECAFDHRAAFTRGDIQLAELFPLCLIGVIFRAIPFEALDVHIRTCAAIILRRQLFQICPL